MNTLQKLKILTDAAKYDVSCSSSGSNRKNTKTGLGMAHNSGICHSYSDDGRCISLLKILLTNKCIYDCEYCINRRSNEVKRAEFSTREVIDLTLEFYKRNYIEGLFLSSGIVKDPDHTMQILIEIAKKLRYSHKFNGYIHMKAIAGASEDLIYKLGLLVDRMSINIELAREESLKILAPEKSSKKIIDAMSLVNQKKIIAKNELRVYKHAPKFLPAGQTTQMIIGTGIENDRQIIEKSFLLYQNYKLKRVFYSAFIPVVDSKYLNKDTKVPLLREHRLYQADWLMRFYNFKSSDIITSTDHNLDLSLDPKTNWAIENIEKFPVEINKASFDDLLKVPGFGRIYARRIVEARKSRKLTFDSLKSLKISTKKAKNFITASGKYMGYPQESKERLREVMAASDMLNLKQISIWD